MVLLVNKEDVERILQVAIGYDEKEFNNYIREAQEFDVKPLLCENFYFELIQKREEPEWSELITGIQIEENGIIKTFRGIGDSIAYFAYARFIRKSNNVSTSHGFVTKKTPYSEPLSTAEKDKNYLHYQMDANKIFDEFAGYMNSGRNTFASWSDCRECSGEKPFSGFTTYVIK